MGMSCQWLLDSWWIPGVWDLFFLDQFSLKITVRLLSREFDCTVAVSTSRRWNGLGSAHAAFAQQPYKGLSKVSVEYAVEHGIDSGVAVAQPEYNGKRFSVPHPALTHSVYEVHEGEGQPADGECQDDNRYSHRGSTLPATLVTLSSRLVWVL